MTSPYLDRPLRSIAQAHADLQHQRKQARLASAASNVLQPKRMAQQDNEEAAGTNVVDISPKRLMGGRAVSPS